MIDFVRFKLPSKYTKELINHPQLNWIGRYVVNDGEDLPGKVAYILNQQDQKLFTLTVVVPKNKGKVKRENYIKLEGSLHYLKENQKNNSTSLSIKSVQQIIRQLAEYLKFDNKDAEITCIEYGANFRITEPPSEFMKAMVMHKSKPFKHEDDDRKNDKDFYRCKHDDYFLKIYDKGLQYHRPNENLLRVEKRTRRMKQLNSIGIRTLDDLAKWQNLKKLAKDLVSCFNEIVVFDPKIDIDKLDLKTQNWALKYSQEKYWKKIINPNTRKKTLQRFRKKVTELAERNLIDEFTTLLKNEINSLFKDKQGCTLFPHLHICEKVYNEVDDQRRQNEQSEIPTCTPITTPMKMGKGVQNEIDGNSFNPEKVDTPILHPKDQLAFVRDAIGENNHLTNAELVEALKSYGQPDSLIKSMLLNGVLAATTPYHDQTRYYLPGSTPF